MLKNKYITISAFPINGIDDFEWMIEKSNWVYHSLNVTSKNELITYFDQVKKEYEDKTSTPFKITLNENNEVIGFSRYRNISYKNKRLEIGGWLRLEYRKRGLNQLIRYELLKHAFEDLKFNRVEMFVNSKNLNSKKSLRLMGVKNEGVLRKYSITQKGEVRDMLIYSVISTEWNQIKFKIKNEFSI